MRNGVDILVATPGRLLDLVRQKYVRLDKATTLVLDEADRMFDMGFIKDVRKLISFLPKERLSLLFSATMPKEVAHLCDEVLRDPVRIEVTPKKVTADAIEQRLYHVAMQDKRGLLHKLLRDDTMKRVIVFTRTKHGANKVADQLGKNGYSADAIHGNKSQNARQRALEAFRAGEIRVLVATDIAARGIDIDDITHVVNFDLPHEPESYVHRIGRTARAGGTGIAIAFCDPSERTQLRDIERLIRNPLTVVGTPAIEALPVQESHAPRHNPRNNHRPHGPKKQGHKHNAQNHSQKPHGEKRDGANANDNGNRPRRRRKFRGNRNGQQRAA